MKKVSFILGFLVLFIEMAFTTNQNVDTKTAPKDNISFYRTDLVCRAAPHIGCGSKSKPILLDFQKREGVKEAWLNREGTVVAVVWDEHSNANKDVLATTVFNGHGQSFQELLGDDYDAQLADFQQGGQWYQGEEVDELSEEEMEYIRSGKSPSCNSGALFNDIGKKNNPGSCNGKRSGCCNKRKAF